MSAVFDGCPIDGKDCVRKECRFWSHNMCNNADDEMGRAETRALLQFGAVITVLLAAVFFVALVMWNVG